MTNNPRQTTAAAALLAALEALDASDHPQVRAAQRALADFHAELPMATRPNWNTLAGLADCYLRARGEAH